MKFKNNTVITASVNGHKGDFLPTKIADEKTQVKAIKKFQPIVDKLLELDSTLKVDYKNAPYLVVLKDDAPIFISIHPDMILQIKDKYTCRAGIFDNAYSSKESYELALNIARKFDFNESSFKMNRTLDNPEFEAEAVKSLSRIKHNQATDEDFNFLSSGGAIPKSTAPVVIPDVNFTGENSDLTDELTAERKVLAEAISNTVNPPAEILAQQQLLNKNHLEQLKGMNFNAEKKGLTVEWLENALKESELRIKESRSIRKSLPFVNDIVIADKYNKELMKFKTGGDKVSLHKSAFNNDKAIAFAAEVAFKNGIMPVHINVSNKMSETEQGMIIEKSIEALSKHYDLNSIIVPKDYQHLLDARKELELNTTSFEQALEVEAPKNAPVAKASADAPIVETDLNSPATTPAKAVSDAPNEQAPSATQEKTKNVVNGCFLVPSNKGGYLLYGFSDKAKNLDGEVIKGVINKLCELEDIKPEEIKGCWRVARPEKVNAAFLNSLSEIKKNNGGEDLNFKLAYDVLQEIKAESYKNFEVAKIENDVSGFDNETPDFVETEVDVVSPEMTREITNQEQSVEETEALLADLFENENVFDSPEYEAMIEARDNHLSSIPEADDTLGNDIKDNAADDTYIDYASAALDFESVKQDLKNKEVKTARPNLFNKNKETIK
jgi:hypothetical protein